MEPTRGRFEVSAYSSRVSEGVWSDAKGSPRGDNGLFVDAETGGSK
jgi:hypothetical protein